MHQPTLDYECVSWRAGVIAIVITMLELKVRKFGNSLGVVLPQRLQTAEGERLLLIEAPGGAYQLSPTDEELERQLKIAREGSALSRDPARSR